MFLLTLAAFEIKLTYERRIGAQNKQVVSQKRG
jgi:hypothetical protein